MVQIKKTLKHDLPIILLISHVVVLCQHITESSLLSRCIQRVIEDSSFLFSQQTSRVQGLSV